MNDDDSSNAQHVASLANEIKTLYDQKTVTGQLTSSAITTWPKTYPQYTVQPQVDPNIYLTMTAIEGLDELCEALEVEPTLNKPLLMLGLSGRQYSLIDLLRKQHDLMQTLQVLLVHRHIV